MTDKMKDATKHVMDIDTYAMEWVSSEENDKKWSNNTNEIGDNYGSFVAGFNKAKEILFTEEQVKQAINRAIMLTLSDKSCYSDEIIKSLKK